CRQSRRKGAPPFSGGVVAGGSQAVHARQWKVGASAGDREQRESADGAGDGKSSLAASLRRWLGADAQRFRNAWGKAHASRTARLDGTAIHQRRRLVDQETASSNHAFGDV